MYILLTILSIQVGIDSQSMEQGPHPAGITPEIRLASLT